MREPLELFIPGRVCLFGEHSDWAGEYRPQNPALEKGYTLLIGTEEGLRARVQRHPDSLVIRSTLPGGMVKGPRSIPLDARALTEEAEGGGFFCYAAGAAAEILSRHPDVQGLEIDNYLTTLPIKKGLASSAAVCVLVARAFNRLYDLKMTVRDEMEAAYQGEIRTGSRCGRMDQACAFGSRPVLIAYDGDQITVEELRAKQDIHLVIADVKGEKDTVEILRCLNRCFPSADGETEERVRHYLGPVNKEIVLSAVKALQEGSAGHLGALMARAQLLFDQSVTPACPAELAAPRLHRALAHPPLQPYVYGGKGVGSQGDGSVQFVARDKKAQGKAVEVLTRDLGCEAFTLDIPATRSVRKTVIPAAGFGTRLFPATKIIKKELFPVVDESGTAKPVVLAVVEEAFSAGIDEACIIVQKGDERRFRDLFSGSLRDEHYEKLPQRSRDYNDELMELGKRVSLIIQDRQEGFGHAVWCARDWVGDEPFFLMLGDHLCKSTEPGRTGARQLMDVYEKYRTSVVAAQWTPESSIGNFGAMAATWKNKDEGVLTVTEFREKPTVAYARSRLRREDMPIGQYLCLLGQYVLSPEIFKILGDNIESDFREHGEFQLTSALEHLCRAGEVLAYITKGRRFDIGNPEGYLEAITNFGR